MRSENTLVSLNSSVWLTAGSPSATSKVCLSCSDFSRLFAFLFPVEMGGGSTSEEEESASQHLLLSVGGCHLCGKNWRKSVSSAGGCPRKSVSSDSSSESEERQIMASDILC